MIYFTITLNYVVFLTCYSIYAFLPYPTTATHYTIYRIKFYTLNSRKHCNTYHTTYYTTYYIYIYVYTTLYTLLCTVLYARLYTTQKVHFTIHCSTKQCYTLSVSCEFPLQSTSWLMYCLRDRNYVLSCCAAYVVLRIYSGKHCVIMLHYMFLG